VANVSLFLRAFWITDMAKSSIFVNFNLLKQNANFRSVFIARTISVLAFGILMVAVPVQVHQLTGSTLQVSLAMMLDGLGMFIGLLCGGVLADMFDRRRLILAARGTCGLGFLMLAINGFLSEPSLLVLYIISAWDGFFGAVGITALMAATPSLVGRENLAAAGALSMLTTRLAAVIAPSIGGVIIATSGVNWNYLIAGVGTCLTLLPLRRLPAMQPQAMSEPEKPLAALLGGVQFMFQHKLVGAVVLFGTLQLMAGSVRVLFPALAFDQFADNAAIVGFMYSAVPLGAMLAAFTSGWVHQIKLPGKMLMFTALTGFSAIAAIGLFPHLSLMLLLLVVFGYLGAISSLLQFTLVQSNTPDEALGRVNSLWAAQDVVGESCGAVLVGALAKWLTPLAAITLLGVSTVSVGSLLAGVFKTLRRYQPTALDAVGDEFVPQQSEAACDAGLGK
jgi:ENTS family enterobactin (siderophore) exporter